MFTYLLRTSLLFTLSLLTPLSSADFDLYVVYGGTNTNGIWVDMVAGWMVYEINKPYCADIDAEDVIKNTGWPEINIKDAPTAGVTCYPPEFCGISNIANVSLCLSCERVFF